jgi:hypothetical protein
LGSHDCEDFLGYSFKGAAQRAWSSCEEHLADLIVAGTGQSCSQQVVEPLIESVGVSGARPQSN